MKGSDNTHIIIGAKGTGKSTLARALVARYENAGYQPVIFDPSGDWNTEEYPGREKAIFWPRPDDFYGFAEYTRELSGCVVVIEEASMYMESATTTPPGIRSLLIQARHRQNAVIIVFHSIRDASGWLFRQCNTLHLKPTKDTPAAPRAKGIDGLEEAAARCKAEAAKGNKYHTEVMKLTL